MPETSRRRLNKQQASFIFGIDSSRNEVNSLKVEIYRPNRSYEKQQIRIGEDTTEMVFFKD